MTVDGANAGVVIVGASAAGCAAALELAGRGIPVHLLERRPQSDTRYKKICTHLIHPSGRRWLADFGLLDDLLVKGGQGTYLEVTHEKDTLCYPLGRSPSLVNIERRHLDPALRQAVINHPLVNVHWGYRVDALIKNDTRVSGVLAQNAAGESHRFEAPLVIAADGRSSRIGVLDGATEHRIDCHRVALFSYFEAAQDQVPSKIWSLDQGAAYVGCIPNGPRVVLSCYISRARFDEIRDNVDAFFQTFVVDHVKREGVPLGAQCDELFVAKDTSTLYRRSPSTGLLYVGDAFLAADPLTGVGCAWAMSSARLLAKTLAPALKEVAGVAFSERSCRRLDWASRRYRLKHWFQFFIPALGMALISSKGKWVFNPVVLKPLAALTRKRPVHPGDPGVATHSGHNPSLPAQPEPR